MDREKGHSDTAAGGWEDTTRYRALITIDRRHWAWLWLKRNHNYQAAARRVAETTSWQTQGAGGLRLLENDLNRLFPMGYLSISLGRAMTNEMPGFFGTRMSIHPSSWPKPNLYPLFLVDDTHPIDAGRLPNGEPDLYFRGFYAWNSEVGSKTLGIASFYLRAVCQNRNLWGVEGFQQISIRHSKFAAQRFAYEAAPALTNFANSSPAGFIAGIKAARAQVVAKTDEDRETFLTKRGFSKPDTTKIIQTVLNEEGKKPESVFDFVQGITALARAKTHQDTRLDLEGKAKKLMAAVA